MYNVIENSNNGTLEETLYNIRVYYVPVIITRFFIVKTHNNIIDDKLLKLLSFN